MRENFVQFIFFTAWMVFAGITAISGNSWSATATLVMLGFFLNGGLK